MNKEKMEYMKTDSNYVKLIRTEILFTPLLIILPIIVSVFLIYDWLIRGFLVNNSSYDVEFLLGVIILIGNIIFDIPFIKSLKILSKGKN
jgi:hypothetical protein